MDDTQRMQERLTRMRQEILERTGAVQRDLRRTRNPDSEERAIEIENDPVLEKLDEGGRQELRQIDAALARIDAGTYGSCAGCGAQIGEGRLEALPFATSCIDCATSAAEAG